MSGRLASFRGPSTPNSSPVSKPKHPGSGTPPASPSRAAESPIHRKIRTLLLELRTTCQKWDDLVLIDGLRAAKQLVDARTSLEWVFFQGPNISLIDSVFSNSLASIPTGDHPRSRIVGPKLHVMDKSISDLDTVIIKLVGGYSLWPLRPV